MKPIVAETDNKGSTRFFHAPQIPPTLSTVSDNALQFNFLLLHVPGVRTPAADIFCNKYGSEKWHVFT